TQRVLLQRGAVELAWRRPGPAQRGRCSPVAARWRSRVLNDAYRWTNRAESCDREPSHFAHRHRAIRRRCRRNGVPLDPQRIARRAAPLASRDRGASQWTRDRTFQESRQAALSISPAQNGDRARDASALLQIRRNRKCRRNLADGLVGPDVQTDVRENVQVALRQQQQVIEDGTALPHRQQTSRALADDDVRLERLQLRECPALTTLIESVQRIRRKVLDDLCSVERQLQLPDVLAAIERVRSLRAQKSAIAEKRRTFPDENGFRPGRMVNAPGWIDDLDDALRRERRRRGDLSHVAAGKQARRAVNRVVEQIDDLPQRGARIRLETDSAHAQRVQEP